MDVYIPTVYMVSLSPGIQLLVRNGQILNDGCLYIPTVYADSLSPGIHLLVTNGLILCDGCIYTYSIYGLVITWNTVTCNEWANIM